MAATQLTEDEMTQQPDHEIELVEDDLAHPPRPEEEVADSVRRDAPAVPQPQHD
jgi:hypothetical protein